MPILLRFPYKGRRKVEEIIGCYRSYRYNKVAQLLRHWMIISKRRERQTIRKTVESNCRLNIVPVFAVSLRAPHSPPMDLLPKCALPCNGLERVHGALEAATCGRVIDVT